MNTRISQANQIKPTDITAIVLAGGKSSRMGGLDKGLVLLRGKPLIQWVIEAIRLQVSSVIISANRNTEDYRKFGYPVVSDSLQDYQGPLAGIAAGLNQVETKFALVVPVDTPILPIDFVERLSAGLMQSTIDLTVVQVEDKLQPAHLLLKSNLADNLNSYLESGGRRMQGWVSNQNHATVSFESGNNFFRNINSKTELLEVESDSLNSQ